MKKRKKLWRVVKPLLLVGFGLMVGIILVEANSSSVVIHHDFEHDQLRMAHEFEIEMEHAEMEIERLVAELEAELVVPFSPAIPVIPEVVVPPIPAIPEISSDGTHSIVINEYGAHIDDGGFRLDPVEMIAIVGGLGLATLFLMMCVAVFDEIRGRRRS